MESLRAYEISPRRRDEGGGLATRCDMKKDFGKRGPLGLVAIPAGFEPATHGVEIRYSIQLSYGTVGAFIAPRI